MLKHLYKPLKSSSKHPNQFIHISLIHTRNKTPISNPAIEFILDEFEDLQSSNSLNNPVKHASKSAESVDTESSCIQISHQWPEWVALMKKLTKFGYFDGVGNPFRNNRLIDAKSFNQIRTACLNFARDRPNLMRYFTVRDIQIVAASGCPSTDRKVVNSGKRLRAHMGIDEGNVCSSCIYRGNCERAYVKAHEEGCHTVDLMRVVVTFGLECITYLETNKPLIINKRLEEAIRSLIKDMVKFRKNEVDFDPSKQDSSVKRSTTQQQDHRLCISKTEDDWICPKCKLLNVGINVKCIHCNGVLHEKLKVSEKNKDHVQIKKGDWICTRCKFLNYAKNTRCLRCNTNPSERQLNPGEWVCDSCNYINFKRNMVCLKCNHNRPKAFNNSRSSFQHSYNNRSYNGWIDNQMIRYQDNT